MPSTIEKTIDVQAPISVVYNQWTQFEEFPHFMEGVTKVEQLTDTTLRWTAEIAGQTREWTAQIVEQVPDIRVSWKSTSGADNAGIISFLPIEDGTRVTARMTYDPEGFIENVGDFLGFVSLRVQGDLDRFKQFIEARGRETGAWRGEVHRKSVTSR
jgi:uncharacterized membrane protein